MQLPVDVQGLLRVDSPTGRSFAVRAEGNTLHVDVPGWAEIKAAIPETARARRQRIRFADDMLRVSGLKLSLEKSGKPFLQLGHETRPSWLARFVGLAPANLRPSAIGLFLTR